MNALTLMFVQPHGVGVVIECVHLCMAMRGVQKPHSTTVTSCMLGDFKHDARTRSEFLHLVRSAPYAQVAGPAMVRFLFHLIFALYVATQGRESIALLHEITNQ